MLLTLLFTNTAHFALSILGAFVFFAGGLLFFDSWKVNKAIKTPLIRSFGFFILSIVASFEATSTEIPLIILIFQILKIVGLTLIFMSLLLEPVLHAPKKEKVALVLPLTLSVISWSLIPLSAVLFLLTSATYFRKATEGLEKQLKPAFYSFLLLGIAEGIRIHEFFANTPVVFWQKMFAEFGVVWSVGHTIEFIGILILATWLWGYIRFRMQIQLFVMTFALSLIIFLTTTVFYTFLLVKNLENDALAHLKTDVSVLQYSLASIGQRTLAQAQAIAQDSEIKQAFIQNDTSALYSLTTDFMTTQQTNTLLIASASGEVVMRTEDKERTNDNISVDPIVAQAVKGNAQSTVDYHEAATIPEVGVKAAVPLREGSRVSGKIIGVVVTGLTIDSAFVDGVKAVTGLDIAVFGKNKRAATTFLAPDGKSRFVGTIETNKNVIERVLNNGEIYIGAAQVLNQPFYTAYAPIKTVDSKVVGMLFVGKLQNTLTDAAKRSIDLTFLGSIVLMVISLIPTYFFSKYLQEHLEA